MNISVTFPSAGRIVVRSRELFGDPDTDFCRRFVAGIERAEEILGVSIGGDGAMAAAEIRYHAKKYSLQQVLDVVTERLSRGPASYEANGSANGHANGSTIGHANGSANGHANGSTNGRSSAASGSYANGRSSELLNGRRYRGVKRVDRDRFGPGEVFAALRKTRRNDVEDSIETEGSGWRVTSRTPGRIRLRNDLLLRKKEVCQAIERELMSVLGIEKYTTSATTGSVLIVYDRGQLNSSQIVEILDSALRQAEIPLKNDRPDLHLPVCTFSVAAAAVAQFVAPPLLPFTAALFAYTSIPTFKEARVVLFKERRLGVDVLDSIVVIGCLSTMSIFPGAVLCWCLGFGKVLVKKTQDDSKKLLLSAFGKQPRYVWLYREGAEVQVPLEKLEQGDVIVVNTGEVVPVDGFVREGMAMIDQHALTGESAPAEKGIGDRVFAATVMVAGKIFVEVERSGNETASAKISQILNDSAGYKLTSQHKGERLADKAVIPTLALGSLGLATMGPAGAVAVLNSDFGTGIRMAAPLAMLSTLALCAHKGILVKDGRALELMNEIDTVLFDKTGTLTRERPEVGRIVASAGFEPDQILRYAAAAENKFAHPIAKAILHRFEELGVPLPMIDDSKYHVGYGITVHVEGRTIRVGSARFMDLEGVEISPEVKALLADAHDEGHTLVMVAVDDRLGGAIELQASVRPEVREIVKGLRDRGIKHIAIISGDHEAPTRKLAQSLGMDRYFAQVLPADKASYVEQLQSEGKKVCFVGDGINDSIALKKANVSISLRGASSIATDTAHIVFMEEGLSKLCDLRDISRDLDRNVRKSWHLIIAPNALCIGGAFFLGFGIMASVVTNNVAALAALANGMLPLRKIAEAQAESEHEQEMRLAYARERGFASHTNGERPVATAAAAASRLAAAIDHDLTECSNENSANHSEANGSTREERTNGFHRNGNPPPHFHVNSSESNGVHRSEERAKSSEEANGRSRPAQNGVEGNGAAAGAWTWSRARHGELLVERTIARDLDDRMRKEILVEIDRRRDELDVDFDAIWSDGEPVLTVDSRMFMLTVVFQEKRYRVYAKLSLAARMFARDRERERAVEFIDSIARDLDLQPI